jgi:thiamine biosynthesis protein ThiS
MRPILMLVTDRKNARLPLPELTREAIAGGVDLIQIREKDLDDDELRRLTGSVLEAVADPSRILVNGSIAVAKELGIGLHLPERGVDPTRARGTLGPGVLIGRSIHSAPVATEGIDYVIAGHIFATASKPELPPLGVDGLSKIAGATTLPVYAIGGISPENARACLRAGARGVTVMSAINGSADPASAARAFRVALDQETESVMETVKVTINGKSVDVQNDLTIKQFLDAKGYHDRLVVVELNEKILQRPALAETVFRDGDRVEIVHFVGGG